MREDFTLANFLKAIGVDKNSCLKQLFKDMFNVINEANKEIYLRLECENSIEDIISTFNEDHGYYYNDETSEIIKNLLENNRKVYMGYLSDNGTFGMELFLCTTSIIMHNEDIYFNAEMDSY
jgi:hypothetical protein